MSVLRGLSFLFGFLCFIGGGILSFAPWIEDDGDYYSVDSFHTMCQDGFIAALASDECEIYNSYYSLGLGLIVIGVVLLLAGIIPTGQKQPIIVNNPPTQTVEYQYSPRVQQPVHTPVQNTEMPNEGEVAKSSQRFCTNCGHMLASSAKFCTQCGSTIKL